ncbi:hypothetical protein FQA47_020367 [Oryzias melastigma]|uniref:Uncharacterized protein n=1 Tax=Oryzias melastigma TaxID=30732 RepID=A0A834C9C2_ORYME|nr:hypothetical protein FQA47_020367 [Oryzias melastigma]
MPPSQPHYLQDSLNTPTPPEANPSACSTPRSPSHLRGGGDSFHLCTYYPSISSGS